MKRFGFIVMILIGFLFSHAGLTAQTTESGLGEVTFVVG